VTYLRRSEPIVTDSTRRYLCAECGFRKPEPKLYKFRDWKECLCSDCIPALADSGEERVVENGGFEL